MYKITGFREKEGALVKENLKCGPGKLWNIVRDYEAYEARWTGKLDVEPLKEMLEAFLKTMNKLGVEEIELVDPAKSYHPDEKHEPVRILIKDIQDERFSEIAAKIATNDVELSMPQGAVKGYSCSFTNRERWKPEISVWMSKASRLIMNIYFPGWDLMNERGVFCLHIKDNKLLLHLTRVPHDRGYEHSYRISKNDITAVISDLDEVVEFEFPETGLQFERSEIAHLDRLLFEKYLNWLLDTERFKEYKKFRKDMEKLNMLKDEEVLEAAEKAVEEMRKCEYCKKELGERINGIEASTGRLGAVIVYALSEKEEKEIYGEEKKAVEAAEKTYDMVLTKQHKTLADVEREFAEKKLGAPLLAPVHLYAHWNWVEVYVGHDSHPISDIAERIKKHVTDVLSMKGIHYKVQHC